ncbi:hypothetical protein [Streptomyces caniscabiei]|uniref:Secreted protein n=1 Tax=Streptomyces caniscabiei TaxID=2746961 RepID=A0ABU4N889_9ACTN|nr:hypothetical protein [Streptomyces caniscabiei]MBE4741973.1 hypothetical protein [Streptomyces caniscabiei]MBE4762748.1 hypothetical protein [Streptomyces caniscabiei]MBE4776006.1 hypothetical protein [Streptomyces caniscabiei]MBE4790808.1 hypothetical protein [Streptomyces caniscabiei]MBE4799971.1 hypothetical protein [Streptomyces caniscabiei]
MEATIRKRTALTVCGFALCGALAAPAAIEVASIATGSGQTQVDHAERQKPKKEKKDPKPPHKPPKTK